MSIRVADYIMEKLGTEGAKHIFMITGRGVLYLSDAVAKSEHVTGISMHHEQACAYAAMSYGIYNSTLGVCLVSTGCAATNALTGVLCAWQDGIPMVVVSGQNTLKETQAYSGIPLRTWGQQEADIVSVASPITKYAVMLTSAKRSVYEVEKALYLATHGRKGPVWIDVPLDIQNMRIDPDDLDHFNPSEEIYPPAKSDLEYITGKLNHANRPIVLFGSGIRHSDAVSELKNFLETNGIPAVYSASAPDVYGYEHPLCVGSVGTMACSRSGCFALQNADFVLVIGNRLSPMTTGPAYEKFAREAEIAVVDIDEIEHSKNTVRIDRFIKADAKLFLTAVNGMSFHIHCSEWANKCAHWKQIFPLCENTHHNPDKVDLYHIAESLSQHLPTDSIFISDAGIEELIFPSNIIFRGSQRCIHPTSQGAMGFALPAAIGAYYASGKPVVTVVGDGSVMMNIQELLTIQYHHLPIKIIVVNNGMYSVIRKRQKDLFRTRTIGTDTNNGVGTPNFAKIADCFDFQYMHITSAGKLNNGLSELMKKNCAVICEIDGLENQDYTACAVARNSEKKFVQRPLEDQAPFMDRELFLKEMIVNPIDQ